jgi:FlaA1/EpsC-like NDP-sugar epimerase
VKNLLLKNRRWLAEALDLAVAALALAASFLLRLDFTLEPQYQRMLAEALPLALAAKLLIFRLAGLRHLAWRYLGFPDLLRIALAHALASVTAAAVLYSVLGPSFPRSIYGIDFAVCLTLALAARAAMKLVLDRRPSSAKPQRRILIYGAGNAGLRVLSEIRADRRIGIHVAGFLDDDPHKRRMQIYGMRVLGGREELGGVARKHRVEEVLIALPRATAGELTAILEACHEARVEARRVPALAELIESKVLVDQIRKVRLEDLLGRPPVELQEDQVRARLSGRVVLVTGAGGSIGSELCRQIARYRPRVLIGFDHSETALYDIEQELARSSPEVRFYPEVGSIQSRRRLEQVFRAHRPQSVYHAAAYKHVPLMEAHLFEAVENNVFGTANVARCAANHGVEDFVLVSSDKAVRPTNVMGATKRLAELVCQMSGCEHARTRFVAVRFGNVLGSNGSVIPRFEQQIARGGPITVTHPDMRRFFMTIPEAAQLVLEAAAIGSGGEIFVLDMGEPVRIVDLARKMVLLSGLRPDRDIRVVFSGIRPGEKLYEEVSAIEEDTAPTPHAQIRVFSGPPVDPARMHAALRELRRALDARHAPAIVLCLKELVDGYNPSAEVLKQAFEQRGRERFRVEVA